MSKKVLNNFSRGFISELDMDTIKIPDNALSDCLNIEINNPLLAIGNALGYDTDLVVPSYSGSRNVAVRKWSVDTPSSKELTTLIRASNNFLLYSEDYEMPSWVLTAAGATLTANNSTAPIRKADVLTNCASTTKLAQTATVINSGNPHTFSVRLKKAGANMNVRLSIDGTTSTQLLIADGAWHTFEVSKSSLSGTSIVVSIEFVGATGTDTFNIWGSQLEEASTSTGYGHTANYARPYYFYLYPYYNGTTWINDWLELNDFRCCAVASVTATTVVSTLLGESDDFFNGWNIGEIGTQTNGGFVRDYTSASGTLTIPDSTGIVGGDNIIISRFARYQEIPIKQSLVTEAKIQFNEYVKTQTIGMGLGCTPIVISYIDQVYFNTSTKPLTYKGFNIEAENKYTTDTTYTDIYSAGIKFNPAASATGLGNILNGDYSWWGVAVIDGQRYCMQKGTVTIGVNDQFNMIVYIYDGLLSARVEKAELYINTTPGDTSESGAILQMETSLVSLTDTWSHSAGSKLYIGGVDRLDFLVDTVGMTQNLQRSFTTKAMCSYDYRLYLRGRAYVAGINIQSDAFTPYSYDYVRFSGIANLIYEVNSYPFVLTSSYGYIVVESGTADDIKGIGVTPQSDLLIFKNKTTFLYEVSSQSSQLGKRLINAFKGIGCTNWRGIINNSDYGTFWYDDNDIYRYLGGINAPTRISLGKISKYWRSLKDGSGNHWSKDTNLASSFGFFNKRLNEYWIFTRTQSTYDDYRDYKCLRYSVEFDNWNIMQFPEIIIGATEDINGELKLLTNTGNILKYGYTTSLLVASYFKTHCINFEDSKEFKNIDGIWAEYSTTNNLGFTIYLNDEVSARSGNAPVFLSTKKNDVRNLRNSSICRKVAIKGAHASAGANFNISEIGLVYEKTERPYGR